MGFQFLLFMMRPDLYCAMNGKSQLPLDSYGNAQPPKTIIRLVRPDEWYIFYLGEQDPQWPCGNLMKVMIELGRIFRCHCLQPFLPTNNAIRNSKRTEQCAF